LADPVKADGSGGSNVHFMFGLDGNAETINNNSIENFWCEGVADEVVAIVKQYSTINYPLRVTDCQPVEDRTQIWMAHVLANRYWTATQTGTKTCTVADADLSTLLLDGYKVFFTDGTDWFSSTCNGPAVFGGVNSTVTINDARFPAGLTTLYRAMDYNNSNPWMGGLSEGGKASFYDLFAGQITVSEAGTIINGISHGTLTLVTGGGLTETVVTDANAKGTSRVFLFPYGANAAVAGIYISTRAIGSFTVTHPANPGASANMFYLVIN
jgi:hypothetical protein